MKKYILLFPLAAAAIFSSCKKEPGSNTNNSGTVVLDLPETPYKYLPGYTPDFDEKATLGRVLFYDQRLSLNNSVSCASCHKQALGFADNVALSRGYENKLTGRNSMSITNLQNGFPVFNGTGMLQSGTLFWDGRENSIPSLVTKPISNHIEMGIADVNTLPGKLAALPYYQPLFQKAFGSEEITVDRISEAFFYFLLSIRSDDNRFESYMRGVGQLTAQELSGFQLFNNTYNCNNCHHIGGFYSSLDFMNIGLDYNGKDKGKGAITGNAADMGTFKVPDLHNVALSAPYMHDGRFNTLDEVLEHYSHGIKDDGTLDSRLKVNGQPMRMNISAQDKQAIIAFLNTLTDYRMISDPKFSNPFKVK